jgi:hypothetical protein
MLDNPMVSSLGRYYARQDRGETLAEKAYTSLRDELADALMADPQRLVRTPGYSVKEQPAAAVIGEDLCDEPLHELLRIVALCAQGKTDAELHLRAAAWIAARAAEHAAFHRDDLLAEMEDDA